MNTMVDEFTTTVVEEVLRFQRQLISERTKAALAEKKAQGVRLGRPRTISEDAMSRIRELRAEGLTFRAIADRLNAEGVPTGLGVGTWFGSSVSQALKTRAGDTGTWYSGTVWRALKAWGA